MDKKYVYKSHWNKEDYKCDCCGNIFSNCIYCGQPKLPKEDHSICTKYWLERARMFPEHYRYGPKSLWLPKLRKRDLDRLKKLMKDNNN